MLLQIIDETKKSIENECFIAALSLAITLPDICGKAAYPKENVGPRYIKWYDTYIGKYEMPHEPTMQDMPYSSGELVYSLRNSLLHQGTPNINTEKIHEKRCQVDRFILTIDEVSYGGTSYISYIQDSEIEERVLEVNIINLCSKLCTAAKSYYLKNESKFDFFKYELHDIRYSYSCRTANKSSCLLH